MANIGKIIGPPGTGKTTTVMNLIGKAAQKYAPEKIGAISYTNAAVGTLKERVEAAAGKGGIAKNVSTVHSLAHRLVGSKTLCDPGKGGKEIQEFSEKYPNWKIPKKTTNPDDDDFSYHDKQNINTFNRMNILRNQMLPPEKWDEETKTLWSIWSDYLNENDYTDFTGMLENCYRLGLSPDIDVLFVDEAQDLTLLQYELTRNWAENTVSTLYVGDSDQSIYRWNGVAPEVFIGLNHQWYKVLDQSYRLPEKILNYAHNIIKCIESRENVTYKPIREGGTVHTYLYEPDLSLPGTHMILCRCNYIVDRWIRYLRDHGQVWCNPYREKDLYWNPTLTKTWKAYDIYQRVQKGHLITGSELKMLVSQMMVEHTMEHGVKSKIERWHEPHELYEKYSIMDLDDLGFKDAFVSNRIPVHQWINNKPKISEYIQDIYTTEPPRIVVGTIHSAKGAEADHVWVDEEITKTIHEAVSYNYNHAHDDEARVAYVAVTRARETLGILRCASTLRNIFLP